MKKRLLSLLLVACMLLSLVPVFSTVAVAADTDKESTYDYSKLYVTDGLLGLYTAYTGDSTLDLANKVWKDISGKGNDATVNGTWTAGTYGGFGYDLAANNAGYNLTFPSDVLPTDEYTLEIIASVRGLTANADGVSQTVNSYNDPAGISLGRLRGFFWFGPQGDTGNWYYRYMNSLTCFVTEAATTTTDGWSVCGSAANSWNNAMKGWCKDTSITNVTIGLHSTDTQYVYTYWKDGNDVTPSTATYPGASLCDITEGSAYQGSFVLFRSAPATVYSVRLYADTLTKAEKAQNHFADVAAFYQLDLADFDKLSADEKQNVYNAFGLVSLNTEDYDSVKASAQSLLGVSAHEEIDYNALYVKKGLVGLYSSFLGDNNIDAETGAWTDLSGKGNTATLVNIGAWKMTAFGAIGYDDVSLTTYKDGTGTSTLARSLKLPESFNTANWTVEAFINYRMYVDENDARLAFDDGTRGWNSMQTFRFGLLGCFVVEPNNFRFRWSYSYWTQGALNYVMGPDGVAQGLWSASTYKKYYNTGASNIYNGDDAFKASVNSVGTFGFTKATADDGTVTWTGYDQVVDTQILSLSSTRLAELEGTSFTYTDSESVEQTWDKMTKDPYALHQFTLFNESPVYIYAVRAYDRVLTDAEKNYNYFIDACAFYGIDLSDFATLPQARKDAVVASLVSTVKGYGMQDGDLAAYVDTAKKLDALLRDAIAPYVLNAYDRLYAGMDGTATANGGKVTMYLSAFAGTNSVNIGGLVWYDKAGTNDATFKNYAGTASVPAITWSDNRDGKNGVGYDLLGGISDGVGSTLDTSKNYNISSGTNAYLQLKVSVLKALNDSDFSLDYVVNYHKIHWYDTEGNLHTEDDYLHNTYQTNLSDMIGVLRNCYQRGNVKGGMNFARETRWWQSEKTTGFGYNWTTAMNTYQNSDIWYDESRETSDIYTQTITRAWNTETITFDTYILYNAEGTKVAEYSLHMLSAYSSTATLDTTGATQYYVMLNDASTQYVLYAEAGDTDTAVYSNLWTGVFTDLASVVTTDAASPVYLTVGAGSGTTRSVKYTIGHDKTGATLTQGIRNITYYENFLYAKPLSVANELSAQTKNTFYIGDDKAADFFMFKQSPVTVYSIRLYDAALTEAEKLQNHFADIAAYYALDIEKFTALDSADKAQVYEAFAKERLGASTAAAMQKRLDNVVGSFSLNAYDLLYVGANGSETVNGGKLLLLYNAYEANNSAVPEIGTWFNKVGDADATFVNGTAGTHDPVWEMRGNGVGYDVYGGQLKADGTINTATYLSFTNTDVAWSLSWGTRLDLPLDVLLSLNDGDYTLDYIAKLDSLKVRNADDTADADVDYTVDLGYRHYNLAIGSFVAGVEQGTNNAFQSNNTAVNVARWAFVQTGWDTGSYNNNQMYADAKTYATKNTVIKNTLVRDRTNGVPFDVYAFYEVDENGKKVSETPIGMVSKSTWNNAKVAAPAADVVYTMTSEAISGSTDVMYIFTAKGGDALAVTSGYGFRSNIFAEHFGDMLGKNFIMEGETRTTDKVMMTQKLDGTKNKDGTYYTDAWATTSTAQSSVSYSHWSRNLYWADANFNTFSLFNLYPCTVYNVRMYDAVLSAAEDAQNHFADLCAYYGVDIEGFANATADAKTAAYEAVAALSFVEETAAEFVATKAKVQAAVDNAKATEFEAGTVLPATVEGVADRVVAVWTNGSAKYLPGTVLAEAATLTPVLVAKGETVNGASVSVANGGLRFKTTFSASDYYTLGKVMGNENAVLSMIIAPELLIEKVANGTFTKKALGADNYVEVAINGYFDLEGDTYTFAAGLSELSAVTKANDLSFAAVLCLTVKVGKETYEIYGDYNADCNRSGLDVLTPYIEDVIAGEIKVGTDLPAGLTDDLYNLYTGFAAHDTALAASLKTALGIQ